MTLRLLVVAAAFAVGASPVAAGSSRFTADDPAWRRECGSCHAAFPPALLTAPAWRQVLGTLERHYGSEASIDAPLAARIGAFLQANAGTAGRAAGPTPVAEARLPRVVDGAWFAREHRKIPAATLARPDVGGFANCAGCHAGADSGDFSERGLRVARDRRLP